MFALLLTGFAIGAHAAAKANTRTNLLTVIPAACGAYIDCGKSCETIKR